MIKRSTIILVAVVASAGASHPNVWAAVGRIPGQFAVSATGDAQYSIPIWTPPGPRGMEPNISLFYDHQSHIGPLGIGWSIAGLGSITRCNKTVAQDGTAAPVALVVGDGYCINGNRLRLTSGTYGTAGSTYQTEVADFSNITANGTAGNGPAYFTVQGRNGLTYQYGYTDANGNGADSQVVAAGTSTALTWMLSKVIDRAGNNYVINYTPLSGTAIPAKILWTPTSAGAASYAYSMVFNYTENVPQSSVNKYVGGTLVSNNELLSSIAVSYGTTVVRDYFLAYQASPSTGRNELKTVTECADSAESNCFLPTTVGYETGTAGVSTTATSALSTSGPSLTARYDLNGDGYPDLVYEAPNSSAWYVAFGSSEGYGTPVNIGINANVNGNVLIGKLTGGTQDSLLANNGGTWYWYDWNGASFTKTSTGIAYDTASYGIQLADINGDGLPDLIDLDVVYDAQTKKSKATIYTRLNTGNGSAVSFSAAATTAYNLGGIAGAQLQSPDSQYGSLRRYDFNGDGLDDLALTVITGTSPNYSLSTYELLANGTTFTQALIATANGSTYTPVFFTNWNDDKCTDFVSSTTLYVSGCDGSVPETFTVGTIVAAMDWDGDGRTDLVVANGSTLGVYLSRGSGISPLVTTTLPYTSTCQYVTMDANGDGLDDLGCWSQTGSSPIAYYLHNGSTDLATSFVDGFGNFVKPIYNSINQPGGNYSAWNDQVFPYQNYFEPLYVVTNVTFSDPSSASGGTYSKSYYYAGAAINLQGRGFSGFGSMQTYDSRSGIWRTTNYSRAFPYTGMMSYHVSAQDSLNTKPIVTVTDTLTSLTLEATANSERYFPYVSTATTNKYEVGGAKNTQLITSIATNNGTPDSYGNFDSVTQTVTDEDSGSPYYGDTWTTTTANAIAPQYGSTWCLNLPTQTTVTDSSSAAGGGAITRTVSYTPDYTNCRETGKVTEPSSSTYKVTEAYTFDGFGNVNTDTVTGVGMAARVTSLTWGTTGQFLTMVQNPLAQSITLGYDASKGVQTSQTDPNYTSANPLQTTWAYDGFARKTQENRPDGTYTTWVYNDCATNGGCLFGAHAVAQSYYIYAVGNTVINDGTTEYDTVDRPIMANAEMISGYNRNEVRYDSLGRVAQQAMPCTYTVLTTACPYWTTNTYDILNRMTQSQRPISASNNTLQTTAYGYAGRTSTVKDALGNTATTITLVTGSLARTQDPKGYYENLSYDAFGALKSVTDSASNTLFTANYAYGLKAFQISSTDMDLGARSYSVDALGEVTGYSDAKGQSFSQTYDALSRPLIRTDLVTGPDLTTTWTWGNSAASYNIGKLQSVTAAGANGTYAESYSYDSLTRPQTKTISVPSDSSYTYISTYSSTTGLLNTLTYPTSTAGYSLALQYGYTNGILQQVKDANSSTVFWQDTGMNPRGQVTQETLGNGIVTNRAFDAVTGWVASIQSGVGGGAGVQNQSYLFDFDGNVTQRQDNNEGLTENFYYDGDNRLDHSVLNGTVNLQMTYDAGSAGPGNITARSDVASGTPWTYDPVRKHAVTQAGTGGYAYV